MINEDFLRENSVGEQYVTGQDVADLLGMGDVYKRGKEMEKMDNEMTEQAKNKFSNMFKRMNEARKKNQKEVLD